MVPAATGTTTAPSVVVYEPPPPRSFLLSAISRFAGLTAAPTLPKADRVVLSSQKCAAARALDTESENPLAPDPYARLLAGTQYDVAYARREHHYAKPRIAIRTKYFDNFLANCLNAVPDANFVLLGAGMDSRCLRLPSLAKRHTVYELDVEAVINVKEHLLSLLRPAPVPRCTVHRLAADLSASAWMEILLEAGFDTSRPTVWLLEGLVYYQQERRVNQLLREIRSLSAFGSWVGFSAVTRISDSRQFVSAMMDPIVSVSNAGFTCCTVDVLGGPNANYGRWPVATPQKIVKSNSDNPTARGTTIYVKASVSE